MADVMVIVSSVRMDRVVTERAIDEARAAGGGLVVLAVLDQAIPNKVAAQFLDSGQIGTRPSQGFLQSVYQRHEQLALQQVDEVLQDAAGKGVEARAEIRRGDYASETAQAIAAVAPATVVIEKRRRSLLRFATEDAFLDKLQREVGFKLLEVPVASV